MVTSSDVLVGPAEHGIDVRECRADSFADARRPRLVDPDRVASDAGEVGDRLHRHAEGRTDLAWSLGCLQRPSDNHCSLHVMICPTNVIGQSSWCDKHSMDVTDRSWTIRSLTPAS